MELLAGKTPKGDELYIVQNPMGHYYIERRGPGPRSELEDQLFTDLNLAKRAVVIYNIDNAKQFAKADMTAAIIQKEERQAHAKTLDNGKLTETLQGE